MNKQERKLKGQYKFKKRLENHGITQEITNKLKRRGIKINTNCYRTTGTPCSCLMCSPGKLEPKNKYKPKNLPSKSTQEWDEIYDEPDFEWENKCDCYECTGVDRENIKKYIIN